jgi:tetratricopeptide (TPR) repeat protein
LTMMIRLFQAALSAALFMGSLVAPASAQEPLTPSVLVEQGIRRHGQRDFDAAIQLYRRALEADPSHAVALYELSFSLMAKGDCNGAAEAATRGTALPGTPSEKAKFWLVLGSCRDRLGNPQAGVLAFKKALELDARNGLAHFNLGVTYARMGQTGEARASFERAVALEPGHASSHYALSRMLQAEGRMGASMLAVLRFLALEPAGPRSTGELARVDDLFAAGVRMDAASGKVELLVNPKTMQADPQMAAIELAMSAAQATVEAKRVAGADTGELKIERLETLLKILGEMAQKDPAPQGVAALYFPFFAAIQEQNLGMPLAHWLMLSARMEASRSWIGSHSLEMQALQRTLQRMGARVVLPPQN